MSNYSRRPISSRASGGMMPCDTQGELKYRLAAEGYALAVKKKHAGEWNEAREFFAEKNGQQIWLETTSKGDRPDWQIMFDTFEKERRGTDQ